MSNSAIPREKTEGYERWEPTSFDTIQVISKNEKSEPDIVLPTARELEEMQRQAHDEGYQAGYAESSQRMAALLFAMEQALQQTDQDIAQQLLTLSLEVARQMVQQTLKINPEILLNTIREAISSLPHFSPGAHLVLQPDDAILVRAAMGEQLSHSGWKIFEDAQLARGGVRIETAHSQIDATVENRWQRIVATIGNDSSWIQE